MVSVTPSPKSALTRWADNLYAKGKMLQNAAVSNELLQLARAIYEQENRNEPVNPQKILTWMDKIKTLSEAPNFPENIRSQLTEVYYSMDNFVQDYPDQNEMKKKFDSQLIWESIVFAFTLWYGGQTFSLQQKDMETELGLDKNEQIRQAIKELEIREVLNKNDRGLFTLNPNYRDEVDASLLFVLSLGINLNERVPAKKGYSTLQKSFINFSKANHHPIAYLTDGLRSYITDYCQRIFGKTFKFLLENNEQADYSVLRRLITRLSIYPDYDFVVSSQEDVLLIIKRLERLKAVHIVADPLGQRIILLKGEITNG
jgi:hypothetical protein